MGLSANALHCAEPALLEEIMVADPRVPDRAVENSVAPVDVVFAAEFAGGNSSLDLAYNYNVTKVTDFNAVTLTSYVFAKSKTDCRGNGLLVLAPSVQCMGNGVTRKLFCQLLDRSCR